MASSVNVPKDGQFLKALNILKRLPLYTESWYSLLYKVNIIMPLLSMQDILGEYIPMFIYKTPPGLVWIIRNLYTWITPTVKCTPNCLICDSKCESVSIMFVMSKQASIWITCPYWSVNDVYSKTCERNAEVTCMPNDVKSTRWNVRQTMWYIHCDMWNVCQTVWNVHYKNAC